METQSVLPIPSMPREPGRLGDRPLGPERPGYNSTPPRRRQEAYVDRAPGKMRSHLTPAPNRHSQIRTQFEFPRILSPVASAASLQGDLDRNGRFTARTISSNVQAFTTPAALVGSLPLHAAKHYGAPLPRSSGEAGVPK